MEPQLGSFESGDPVVDGGIVRLALEHVKVAMSDVLTDTPGREDGQWIEDARCGACGFGASGTRTRAHQRHRLVHRLHCDCTQATRQDRCPLVSSTSRLVGAVLCAHAFDWVSRRFGNRGLRRVLIREQAEAQRSNGAMHPFAPSNYPAWPAPYVAWPQAHTRVSPTRSSCNDGTALTHLVARPQLRLGGAVGGSDA